MCVYNGEKHLREAIESILNQTLDDFEFVIVNDCSKDSSAEIIKSYTDPRIKLLTNETNLGLAASLNVGLKTALGDYIVRMDADDVSLPHRLQTQVNFMDAHPGIGLVGSWVRFFGDLNYFWKPKPNSAYLQCKLLFNTPLPHPSWIIRHSVIKLHNLYYSQTMRRAQDYEYLVRFSKYAGLSCIQQVLLDYRFEYVTRNPVNHNEALKNIFSVRRELFNNLKIEVSEEEHNLHHQLAESRFKENLDPYKTGKWLKKLITANKKEKVFNHRQFRTLMGEIWLQTLYYNLPKSVGAKLANLSLSGTLALAVFNKIKPAKLNTP